MEIAEFKAGQIYYGRFINDSSAKAYFKVLKRTLSRVTFTECDVNGVESSKPKIACVKVWGETEIFKPFGGYSMSLTVKAEARA